MLYMILWYIIRELLEDDSYMARAFLDAFSYLPADRQRAHFKAFLAERGYKSLRLEWNEDRGGIAIFEVTGIQVTIRINHQEDIDCLMLDRDSNPIFYDECK